MKICFKILLLAFSVVMLSCRSSEESVPQQEETEDFFNLKVGNQWVYKTYENNDFTNPQSPTYFTGRVDSVSIVGNVEIQGFTFAKQRTKIIYPNSYINNSVTFRYLRVNSKGHLVSYPDTDNIVVTETGGHVMHPGKDFDYTFNNPVIDGQPDPIGNIFYQLDDETTVTVEGNNYTVLPYKGDFTPTVTMPGLIKKTQDISYKKGLGLVKEICHTVFGTKYLETRLVSSVLIP